MFAEVFVLGEIEEFAAGGENRQHRVKVGEMIGGDDGCSSSRNVFTAVDSESGDDVDEWNSKIKQAGVDGCWWERPACRCDRSHSGEASFCVVTEATHRFVAIPSRY